MDADRVVESRAGATGPDTSVGLWTDWSIEMKRLYGACRDQVIGWQSIEDRVRTQGGSLRGNMSALIRTLLCDLNAIPDTEYATWMDIMHQVGTTGEVVVSVFPGDGTRKEALHTIAGTFSSLNSINRQVKVLTKRLQLEES